MKINLRFWDRNLNPTIRQVNYLLARLNNAEKQLRMALEEAEKIKYNKQMKHKLWTLIGKTGKLIQDLKCWR